MSDKVEWIMEHARGPFRFGVRSEASGNRLLVQISHAADVTAFEAAFAGGAHA